MGFQNLMDVNGAFCWVDSTEVRRMTRPNVSMRDCLDGCIETLRMDWSWRHGASVHESADRKAPVGPARPTCGCQVKGDGTGTKLEWSVESMLMRFADVTLLARSCLGKQDPGRQAGPHMISSLRRGPLQENGQSGLCTLFPARALTPYNGEGMETDGTGAWGSQKEP